jgi:hypothetical protein
MLVMDKRVWILIGGNVYEDSYVLKVYSSASEADRNRPEDEEVWKGNDSRYDHYWIEEWDVD